MTTRKKKRPAKTRALNGTVYSGGLAAAITLQHKAFNKGIFPTPEDFAASEVDYQNRLFAARQEKLGALMALYFIEPDSEHKWAVLAWQLACAHVPGFQVVRQAGRPRGVLDAEVCMEVYSYLQENPGRGITDAGRALTNPGRPLHGKTAKRVADIYSGSPWRKIIEDAGKWEALQRPGGNVTAISAWRSTRDAKKGSRK